MGRSSLPATSRLLQEIADLGEQFFLTARLRRRLMLALQRVDGPDGQKQHESDDEEVERYGEEIAPRQHRALLLRIGKVRGGDGFRQRRKIVRKIQTAGDG